jgi:ribonuclease-3
LITITGCPLLATIILVQDLSNADRSVSGKDFSGLEKKLNIGFKNKDILIQAFCHRSYLNENPNSSMDNNERLEFLGDAVLELVVTENLYKEYPKKSEGELTNWRASLVNARMLSEVARGLGFNNFILLSHGEMKEEGKARQYILANTFEAFVGALYLDQGYEICQDFITKNVITRLREIIEKGLFKVPNLIFRKWRRKKRESRQIIKFWKNGALITQRILLSGFSWEKN